MVSLVTIPWQSTVVINKSLSLIIVLCVAINGCAHSTANPVQLAQVGDETKSCDAIANEMQQMRNQAEIAAGDRNKQVGSNVALGVTGAFLIVPLFFMDLGNAATVEEKAAQARYQRLQQMQVDRKCPVVTPQKNPSEKDDVVNEQKIELS